MTATLHVRVKNDTRRDIAELLSDLDETAEAAEQLGESMGASAQEASRDIANLRQEQTQEIRIIHEQRAGWSALANTALPIIGSMTVATLKYAGTLATLAASQRAYDTVIKPILESQRAMNFLLDKAKDTAIKAAASYAGYGTAVATLGTVLTVATATIKGLELTLRNTGVTAKGTAEDFSEATDEQVAAFNKLADEANAVGIDVDTAMEAAGKSWEDFGVKIVPVVETNLDRVQASASQLKDDFLAFGDGAVTAMKETAVEVGRLIAQYDPLIHTIAETLPIALEKFENYGNQVTENLTVGMDMLGAAIRGVDRDTVQATHSLEAMQKQTVDDFARVRISEQQVAQAEQDRAEAARIAAITTTQAIDGEIQRLKQVRGEMAANDQFNEAAQKKYVADIERMETRRTQLSDQRVKQEADARRKIHDAEKQHQADVQKLYDKAFDDRNAKILKANAAYEKGLDDEVQALLKQHSEQQKAFDQLTQMKAKAARQQKDDYIARWKEAVDQVASIVSGGGGGGNQVQDLRNSLDPRALAKQVGDNRAAQAERDFRESGEGKRREDALVNRGMERTDAERQVMAQQRRIREAARAQGFRDSMGGRANPGEMATAENQVAQGVIQSAKTAGQLSDVMAQGFSQATQAAIEADMKAQQAIQVANQCMNAIKANGQRQRGTNGSLRQ